MSLRRLNTAFTSVRTSLRAQSLLLAAKTSGHRVAMHHGLQRSGTNYLLYSLLRHGVPVMNYSDPARNDPRHKHFRWQNDKATLIAPIAAQYGNDLIVEDIEALNEACGLPLGSAHVVIAKDPDGWLKSICNWGLRCGWFSNEAEALAAVQRLADDYVAFHNFWADIADSAPDRVALVDFHTVSRDGIAFAAALDRIGMPSNPSLGPLRIAEVPMSPRERASLVSVEDIRAVLGGRTVEPYRAS